MNTFDIYLKDGKKIIPIWDNCDMIAYYESIPIAELRKMAIISKFENCCDIELALPYISKSKSLLDVGAGYGRALNYLVSKGYTGELFAIERSKQFYNYLLSAHGDKSTIILGDFTEYDPIKKFDVVLFMWSNISEFPKFRQINIIKKLMSLLNSDGILILETILHSLVPKNVTFVDNQSYYVESVYGIAYGYTPSSIEIDQYISALNLKVEHIDYLTTTERPRVLHIIKSS